jgi:hypothetical protein
MLEALQKMAIEEQKIAGGDESGDDSSSQATGGGGGALVNIRRVAPRRRPPVGRAGPRARAKKPAFKSTFLSPNVINSSTNANGKDDDPMSDSSTPTTIIEEEKEMDPPPPPTSTPPANDLDSEPEISPWHAFVVEEEKPMSDDTSSVSDMDDIPPPPSEPPPPEENTPSFPRVISPMVLTASANDLMMINNPHSSPHYHSDRPSTAGSGVRLLVLHTTDGSTSSSPAPSPPHSPSSTSSNGSAPSPMGPATIAGVLGVNGNGHHRSHYRFDGSQSSSTASTPTNGNSPPNGSRGQTTAAPLPGEASPQPRESAVQAANRLWNVRDSLLGRLDMLHRASSADAILLSPDHRRRGSFSGVLTSANAPIPVNRTSRGRSSSGGTPVALQQSGVGGRVVTFVGTGASSPILQPSASYSPGVYHPNRNNQPLFTNAYIGPAPGTVMMSSPSSRSSATGMSLSISISPTGHTPNSNPLRSSNNVSSPGTSPRSAMSSTSSLLSSPNPSSTSSSNVFAFVSSSPIVSQTTGPPSSSSSTSTIAINTNSVPTTMTRPASSSVVVQSYVPPAPPPPPPPLPQAHLVTVGGHNLGVNVRRMVNIVNRQGAFSPSMARHSISAPSGRHPNAATAIGANGTAATSSPIATTTAPPTTTTSVPITSAAVTALFPPPPPPLHVPPPPAHPPPPLVTTATPANATAGAILVGGTAAAAARLTYPPPPPPPVPTNGYYPAGLPRGLIATTIPPGAMPTPILVHRASLIDRVPPPPPPPDPRMYFTFLSL